MAFDIDDDVEGDVAAAFRGEEAPAREAPATPTAQPAPAPAAAAPVAPEASPGPVRDATGKFAPKEAAAPAPQAPGAAVEAPEAVRPPATWSAQAKADFAALPPHVQAEIAKREADFDKGRQQFEGKAQTANRWDELFASRKDKLAMAGTDPFQAVQRLLAAQDILDRDPRGGILALAQAYGIHPSQLVAQAPGQQQPQQAQLNPALQPIMQRVQGLEQTLTQQLQAQADAERNRHAQSIQQFAADPQHLYFENVRGDMAALLKSGQAKDLADAYDKATWAHPEIRPLLLKQQQVASQPGAQADASAKVSKAKAAGGSVTGSPSAGSSPAQQSNPNASVEDDVRAAFAAHGSRA